ncbi:MAG: glutamate--tRNA ligase family protein [Sulfurovum sp.]|nr:glutamate--tRNA ligase family protein [Sulfurovum sp.]
MLRFAPSPTGDMHIDQLRIALVNYLVAKQKNVPFLVRIDDTNKEAVIEGKDTEIMQILEKFAVIHDRVHHQSEHTHLHQTLAIRLLEEGKAFVCTCKGDQCSGRCLSRDKNDYNRLKESGEPFVLRINKPKENIIYHDMIQGKIITTPDEIEHFVILRSDASPTSDFAAACADVLSGVNLIIENEQKIRSTAKQVYIKEMLGYNEVCHYAHLTSLVNKKGTILTEDDTYSLLRLFAEGFIPDAIINYLLLLSTTDAPKEIFCFPEAIEWFKLEDAPQTPVVFELEELRTINRAHLQMMDDKQLSTLFGFADADIGRLAKLYLEEASTINELAAKIRPILAPKSFEGVWGKQMHQIRQVLVDAPMFETFEELQAYVAQTTGLQGEKLKTPLRLLLTGVQQGPDLQDIYPYIRSYLLEVIS